MNVDGTGQTNLTNNGEGNASPDWQAFGVGGIAELPEVAGTPLDAEGSSSGPSAGLLTAVAAGALALGGAAWYARRWR